ncbi:hypothetical protein AB4865_01820 [Capnocytophaga sp. ARDL2]|uniref:hypothetical protein n=1 Tax=Capnocytophaga sp. ARDL2 TaxID=3238809 RepID=UPI0035575DB4
MNNKNIAILLIASKTLDLISTYLVDKTLSTETSIWVSRFNFGWSGFILVNIIFVLFLVFFLQKVNKNTKVVEELEKNKTFNSFKEYFNYILLESNTNKSFIYKLLFQKIRLSIFTYFFIYALSYSIITMSFIVSLSNFMIYFDIYDLSHLEDDFLGLLLFIMNIFCLIYFFTKHIYRRYLRFN